MLIISNVLFGIVWFVCYGGRLYWRCVRATGRLQSAEIAHSVEPMCLESIKVVTPHAGLVFISSGESTFRRFSINNSTFEIANGNIVSGRNG